MRTIVVLLSFVLLLHAGSDARPIRPPWPSPATDLSSLSLPEEPLSAEQLEVQEYKNQQVDDYVDSTLTHLFDENDIVPDEHTYFGSDTPFNLDEYFHINPPVETMKKGWKKIWEGIQGFFPSSNKITDGGLDDEVITTDGTDGSANGDLVLPSFKRRKKCKDLGWDCGLGKKVWG